MLPHYILNYVFFKIGFIVLLNENQRNIKYMPQIDTASRAKLCYWGKTWCGLINSRTTTTCIKVIHFDHHIESNLFVIKSNFESHCILNRSGLYGIVSSEGFRVLLMYRISDSASASVVDIYSTSLCRTLSSVNCPEKYSWLSTSVCSGEPLTECLRQSHQGWAVLTAQEAASCSETGTVYRSKTCGKMWTRGQRCQWRCREGPLETPGYSNWSETCCSWSPGW